MSSGPKAQYVHYTGPHNPHQQQLHPTTVSPQDTQHAPPRRLQQQQQPQPHASTSAAATINAQAGAQAQGYAQAQSPQQQPAAIVAKGNWTKDLVQLAKTAELKKHALTLQLHTAHILSAHASLTQKDRAVEDIREQRNSRGRAVDERRSGHHDFFRIFWPPRRMTYELNEMVQYTRPVEVQPLTMAATLVDLP
ncbi:hypothetical protein B0H14DRAFT_2603622 [Mycena olivaceomarginata]|nr:hypothetical protein B0H14DRAFT_2603622 [Mycena olivaceomarginata]